MKQKTLKVLEYDKIIELLKGHIVSDLGKELADNMEFSRDISEIEKLQEETAEAVQLLLKRSSPPLYGIHKISDYMNLLRIGGVLNPGALLKVSDFLRVSRFMRKYMSEDDSDRQSKYKHIENLIYSLNTYKKLEDEINNAIVSEEEISDNASPKLASIRRNITRKKEGVREKLNSIITNQDNKKYLQDSIVTMREGRYVIPVKQENKNIIKGLVHDMSSSGATVYIEPMAVVNLNNEIKTLLIEEREEVERILAEISSHVFEYSYEISANEQILQQLDFIFGKGKFALDTKAVKPIINNRGIVNIKNGRHPLLDKDKVVPISIYLGEEFTSLVITGPNTGGKTVTLKTLGLLSLMAQTGLHVTADENSTVAIFNNIYADIGDEQSIEQSLSTFSSHMVNIVDIIENVDENSLVLFDELGAGTDPTEGAALARSIMDFMLEREIRTVATTHYNQLKIYALSTKGVANASMEFNVDTLSPTYKLIIGIPGKSNAFEISSRLGLQKEIIDHARTLVNEDSVEFEKVLGSIEEQRQIIEKAQEESISVKEELKEKREKLEKELSKVNKDREKILNKAREEAREILQKAKDNSELVISEIKEISKDLDREKARRLQEAQDILRDSFKDINKGEGAKLVIEKAAIPVKEIKVGDSVKASSLNMIGTVLELPDSAGNVLVQVGIMKMKLPKNSLMSVEEDQDQFTNRQKKKKIIESKSKTIKPEIDIRGRNYEDAVLELDKYIDDAYLSGIKSVRIIHGKGTGVLREKLQPYFKRHKLVKKVKEAKYNEGGSGVTIIEL